MGSNVSGTIEDLQSDVVAFQPLTAPGESFIDDVLQEPLPALRLVERAAVEDAVQLLTNGLLVGFAPAIERKLLSRSNSKRPEKAPAPPASGAFHTVTYYDQRARPVTLQPRVVMTCQARSLKTECSHVTDQRSFR